MLAILRSFGLWRKLERWKISISEFLRSWQQIKKNHHFEMFSFLILCNNTEQFLDQIVTCNEMWILYNNQKWPAQWLDWEEIPKHFPKSDLQQKMFMVTVCWSVAHQIHYNFLKPGETITSEKCAQSISEMHQKLQHLQPALIKRKGPVLLHDNVWPTTHCTANASIVNKLLWCFASSSILTWPLANQLPLLQASRNFLQGKCFHNQQEAEHTFQKFIESWSTDFYATGINECISHWQNVLIVIVPILINQDIFKLSYKPLQYSYLENPVGREAWQSIVHRFTQSQMWLKRLVIMI